MKIRPLHDRVIVKRMEEERKTASGIVIPDSATEKPDQGEIVAIGQGKVGEGERCGKEETIKNYLACQSGGQDGSQAVRAPCGTIVFGLLGRASAPPWHSAESTWSSRGCVQSRPGAITANQMAFERRGRC